MKRYVRSSIVTDYMDIDTLHRIMSYNKNFGKFNHYEQKDGMVVVTTTVSEYSDIGPYGAVHEDDRYWKFVRSNDRWKVYEIDRFGQQIGSPFDVK